MDSSKSCKTKAIWLIRNFGLLSVLIICDCLFEFVFVTCILLANMGALSFLFIL